MKPMLAFTWTRELSYRNTYDKLCAAAVPPAPGTAPPLVLSPGYAAVFARVGDEGRDLGELYLAGAVLDLLFRGLGGLPLGRTFFVGSCELEWIDANGEEFRVVTAVAVGSPVLLVATGDEFPLDEDFWVDRLLFRVEVRRLLALRRDYRRQRRKPLPLHFGRRADVEHDVLVALPQSIDDRRQHRRSGKRHAVVARMTRREIGSAHVCPPVTQ